MSSAGKYGKASHRKTSWKSLGVKTQGRTTILRINYRNTEEILIDAETRLLYVAMTRSTDRLLMLHHKESDFTQRIRQAIQQLDASLLCEPTA